MSEVIYVILWWCCVTGVAVESATSGRVELVLPVLEESASSLTCMGASCKICGLRGYCAIQILHYTQDEHNALQVLDFQISNLQGATACQQSNPSLKTF